MDAGRAARPLQSGLRAPNNGLSDQGRDGNFPAVELELPGLLNGPCKKLKGLNKLLNWARAS